MKCIKCKTDNVHNANFCMKCAYEFSEKEQFAAEKWTVVGILKRIDNLKEKLSFGWLLDHWAFKIGTTVGVLALGIGFIFTNGSEFKIVESDSYTGKYNEKLDEYYLYSKNEETNLNLYIPRKIDGLVIKHYDDNHKILSDIEYESVDDIVLDTNGCNDYYTLEAKYNENDKELIKLFIYHVEDGE